MTLLLLCSALAWAPAPVDFDTDVLPVLTKAGCNAAACHGAASGRGGFKLSLFAGDPAADYDAIAREAEGRRLNFARPERSLLLQKPAEELDHGGGQRLTSGSHEAELIKTWIGHGAPRSKSRSAIRLEIEPREAHVPYLSPEAFGPEREGESRGNAPEPDLRLHVTAVLSDGSRRRVESTALYAPADPTAVRIDERGAARVLRPGRHTVVVRYLHLVETMQVSSPVNAEPIDLAREPRANWIDNEVLASLEALRIPPSPRADDATLLRRLTLDLTGRLPTPDSVALYLADQKPHKYEALLERLLASPEFTEYWTYRLGKVLRIGAAGQDPAGALAFRGWLRGHVARGTPLDRVAAEMITAEGDSHANGAANFHRVAGDARTEAEYFTESLLGVRLRCANCHNHPLDRWTQDDYHGLAALFARLDRGRNVRILSRGEVTNPRTGEPALPRLPGDRLIEGTEDGRQTLAAWTTSRENGYFAKAAVNRIWKALFGRGLVEPADDLRATNPATHPALLDRLAADFQDNEYDLRGILRLIARSETYARARETNSRNRNDDRYYSHALDRPLEAEVLADAIADVTDVAERYGREQAAARAVSLVGPQVESAVLDLLGRCGRTDTCAASDSAERNLTTRLHLINGPLLNQKLAAPEGYLARSIAEKRGTSEIVAEFYLRALGRLPRADETQFWIRELADDSAAAREQRLQDFAWSLLTCREFTTNH